MAYQNYERTDYKQLAKEFGCHLRFGKHGVKFFTRGLGRKLKIINIVPLDGWVTDPKEVERIMRERGLEL